MAGMRLAANAAERATVKSQSDCSRSATYFLPYWRRSDARLSKPNWGRNGSGEVPRNYQFDTLCATGLGRARQELRFYKLIKRAPVVLEKRVRRMPSDILDDLETAFDAVWNYVPSDNVQAVVEESHHALPPSGAVITATLLDSLKIGLGLKAALDSEADTFERISGAIDVAESTLSNTAGGHEAGVYRWPSRPRDRIHRVGCRILVDGKYGGGRVYYNGHR